MSRKNSVDGITIQHPKTKQDFERINHDLNSRGYIAIDMLKKGDVRNISLAVADAAQAGARDMAGVLGSGSVSNGPLASVAWNFYGNNDPIVKPTGKDGKPLGDGYVKWGAADNIPSVIPPLAMSSPYTAAPLQYLADLAGGLGVRLMYRFGPAILWNTRMPETFCNNESIVLKHKSNRTVKKRK